MLNIKPWLSAIRLRTLPLSISGIILGTCFAHYNGQFNGMIFFLAIMTTLSLQILSNLANDYGDGVKGTDNDDRVGPQRAIQSGQISPDQMFEAIKINILIVIFLTISLIFTSFRNGYFFYGLLFFVLGAISLYSAMRYTIGDKPYGYRGLGDVYVFLFFGLVSVIGSYFLYVKELDHLVILPAISVGLLSVGVLNLNNMRDIDSDVLSDKITLAVKLGKENAKKYHIALIGLAMLLSLIFAILYFRNFYNLLFLITFIPLGLHIKTIKTAKQPQDFDSQLKVLALTTFLFSVLLGVGYIL